MSHWKTVFLCWALLAASAISSPAQTFSTLANFAGPNGSNPFAGVVQGIDGNFYGTTYYGGVNNSGTVFKMTPAGKLSTLYSFCAQSNCVDGLHPSASLVQDTNGNLYGTTQYGGAKNSGTVFKMTPAGKLVTLYSFCAQTNCTDGLQPTANMIRAANGNFYGTTQYGGTNGAGTVFKITPSGTLTPLYSFCAEFSCGNRPYAGLIQATDGNFYGITMYGGGNDGFGYCFDYGCGTVFKITPSGTLTKLYSFCSSEIDCSDGAMPTTGLVQGTDGNLYGTTSAGGADSARGGTAFKITPTGVRTTLYNFCAQPACTDGLEPLGLIQATDGNLYGTTYNGGTLNDNGTIFKMTPSGTLTTLYSFDVSNGANLLQATNGSFYGTTRNGGTPGDGTVFSLSIGLLPFVKTQTTAGKAGAAVNILGTTLTGATSVTFNGTPAQFTVRQPSLITATVPNGATSGYITVMTPTGTLRSNAPFHVIP